MAAKSNNLRFYTAILKEELAALLTSISGVRVMFNGKGYDVPRNAERIVRKILEDSGVYFEVGGGGESVDSGYQSTIQGLIDSRQLMPQVDGIPTEQWLTPYQKRESIKFAQSRSVLYQWPPGGGKSAGGLVWALFHPGTIVLLVPAKARQQWRRQIIRFTGVKPLLLEGEEYVLQWKRVVATATDGVKSGDLPPVGATEAMERAYLEDRREQLQKADALRKAFGRATCSCGAVHKLTFGVSLKNPPVLKVHTELMEGVHTFIVGDSPYTITSKPPLIDPVKIAPRFILTTHDVLPWHYEALVAIKPTTLIIDEPHRIKSHKRWEFIEMSHQAAEQEIAACRAERRKCGVKQMEDGRYGYFADRGNQAAALGHLSKAVKRTCALTATPIKDRTRDLWAILDALEPWSFGTYWSFAARYCAAVQNSFGGMDDKGSSNLSELKLRVDYLRSQVTLAESHAALPQLRTEIYYLPRDCQNRPAAFVKEIAHAKKMGSTSLIEATLAEACSRKHNFIESEVYESVAGGSSTATSKVLIFTARRADCETLAAKICRKLGDVAQLRRPGHAFGAIEHRQPGTIPIWWGHGGDSEHDRDAMGLEYQAATGPAIFIGTMDAFGEAVDYLGDTDLLLGAMLPYTITQMIQAGYRIHRLGKKRGALIKWIVAEGTYDEHIAGEILLVKLPAIEQVGNNSEVAGLKEKLEGLEDPGLVDRLIAKLVGVRKTSDLPAFVWDDDTKDDDDVSVSGGDVDNGGGVGAVNGADNSLRRDGVSKPAQVMDAKEALP